MKRNLEYGNSFPKVTRAKKPQRVGRVKTVKALCKGGKT